MLIVGCACAYQACVWGARVPRVAAEPARPPARVGCPPRAGFAMLLPLLHCCSWLWYDAPLCSPDFVLLSGDLSYADGWCCTTP